MKKILLFLFSIVLFSSCQDENFGYTKEEIAMEKYAKNFTKTYGEIDPNQTWGFVENINTLTRAHQSDYHHYRIKQQDGWDNQKSFTCVDGKNYAVEHEIGSEINWTVGYNYGTNVAKDDMSFIEENYKGPVQQPEKDYVRNYLIEHPDDGDTTCALDSYLIYNLGYLNNGNNVGHMDELYFDDEHFQSYNGSIGYDYYVTNTDIKDPYYHDTQKTGDEFNVHNHYRFYFIPADEKSDFEGGLYLCFDYNDPTDGFDNVYNDWVLKIQPGDMYKQGSAHRVFCEDLGSTHDLDFNDVVYDYLQMTESISQIKIYAVCGTLPIYFCMNGEKVKLSLTSGGAGVGWAWSRAPEIHELLGGKSSEQIYYNANGYGTFYAKCSNIMNLGIMRETDSGMPWYCIPSQQIGKVPFLISCPVGTTPSPEDVNIETTYTKFVGYPSNPYIIWW